MDAVVTEMQSVVEEFITEMKSVVKEFPGREPQSLSLHAMGWLGETRACVRAAREQSKSSSAWKRFIATKSGGTTQSQFSLSVLGGRPTALKQANRTQHGNGPIELKTIRYRRGY